MAVIALSGQRSPNNFHSPTRQTNASSQARLFLNRSTLHLIASSLLALVIVAISSGTLTGGIWGGFTGEPHGSEPWWLPAHENLVMKAHAKSYKVMFYGDSITESLSGFRRGAPAPDRYGVNANAFNAAFKDTIDYDAVALGLAGDQTSHLLWRLHSGEFPEDGFPTVAVVLIGTNDVGAAFNRNFKGMKNVSDAEAAVLVAEAPAVARNMRLIVRRIHKLSPSTKVLLVGLLPRGDWNGHMQPSIFTEALAEVNKLYAKLASRHAGSVKFVDCGAGLLTADKKAIDAEKMPDALHPIGPGAVALLECLKPSIDSLIADSRR